MRPVSQRYQHAVSGSCRVDARARIVPPGLNGTTIADPNNILAVLDVVRGSVTFDSTADVRGTLDLTVTANWWPKNSTDPLTPYGNEIFVEAAVVFGDGSREWVSQGYYRIQQPEQEDAPNGVISVTGSDRMQGIIDDRIPYPLTFSKGAAVTTVIQALVLDTYPWATFDFDSSIVGRSLGADQTTTDDRFEFLSSLVTSYGMIFYWDYRGLLVVKPPPDPSIPLVTISSGAHGVLSTLSRTLSRDGVYNAVIASGEQLDDTIPPVTAMVVDSDPSSPTYWFGQYGRVPEFYSSSFLTTTAQCISAAQSILQQSTGLPYSVDFAQLSNHALEPLDPISLVYPGRRERHVISQIVIPLDAATIQSAQTRQLVNGVFE